MPISCGVVLATILIPENPPIFLPHIDFLKDNQSPNQFHIAHEQNQMNSSGELMIKHHSKYHKHTSVFAATDDINCRFTLILVNLS